MNLALALLLLAAPDWFQAVQYTVRAATLRGCAQCQGEPDEPCELRAGAQVEPFDDYLRQRWTESGRLRLLRPSSEERCAVPAKGVLGLRAPVELAAVRIAGVAPSAALIQSLKLRAPVRGWPRNPQRRTREAPLEVAPDRAALRLAVVCWPSDRGWPAQSGTQARVLGSDNACEWWLLPVTPAGEPDLAAASFAVAEPAFNPGSPRWARVFDRSAPIDESLFVVPPPPQPAAQAAPVPVAPPPAPVRCSDTARERTATLDRFDQWDRSLRGARGPSLDRATLTLDAASWAGHCQELEVLRSALERQLDCALAVEGTCR